MEAESLRAVFLLMPLLRLSDALDRSRGQRIRSVECRMRDAELNVVLNAAPETDIDLELWAAERLVGMFREVYGRQLTLTRAAAEKT
jgi:hypothetical protein